jgi:hypothetical protein
MTTKPAAKANQQEQENSDRRSGSKQGGIDFWRSSFNFSPDVTSYP